MRRIVCLAICFVLLSVPFAYAQELRIGIFDVQKVASESNALKNAKADIDKKFGKQKSDLEKERGSIEKQAAAFQKKPPTDKQQQALAKQHREYTEKTQTFMKLLQTEEQRVREELEKAITQAAKELAAKKGYALILDRAAAPYFDPKLDVTADMLTEINALTAKPQ